MSQDEESGLFRRDEDHRQPEKKLFLMVAGSAVQSSPPPLAKGAG
jgi:hypothetical protein